MEIKVFPLEHDLQMVGFPYPYFTYWMVCLPQTNSEWNLQDEVGNMRFFETHHKMPIIGGIRDPLIPRTLQDTILSQVSFRQYRQSSPLDCYTVSPLSLTPGPLPKLPSTWTVPVNGSRRLGDYSLLMSASGMPRRHTQQNNHSHRMLPSSTSHRIPV